MRIDTTQFLLGIQKIIENAQEEVALFLNRETTLLYWQIGSNINKELIQENRAEFGARIIETTASDSITNPLENYNLDVIIPVGNRVNSKRGTQFRQWATQRFSGCLIKVKLAA